MKQGKDQKMSRRERQIMDIIYKLEEATAYDVLDHLPDPPGYSTVRSWLATMEERGYVKHGKRGKQYLYRAAIPFERARKSALDHLVDTFFKGSREMAATALLKESNENLSEEEKQEIIEKIRKSAEEGR